MESRWWRKISRVRFIIIGIAALYIYTFVFLMPSRCKRLGYSSYFLDNDAVVPELKTQALERLRDSMEYLENRPINNPRRIGKQGDERHEAGPRICISILTTKRQSEAKYLIQTVAKLVKETMNSSLVYDLNIVNAEVPPEDNEDVMKLQELGLGHISNAHLGKPSEVLLSMERYDKHRLDLIEALKICNDIKKYNYALVLEDDAFAGRNFANVLDYVVKRFHQDNTLGFVKLYHPEKWQGFGYDTKLELCLITLTSFLVLFGFCFFVFGKTDITVKSLAKMVLVTVLLCGYIMCFVYTFSRQHLLEFLKFSKYLHFIVNAPGCCTSAVLYPTQVLQDFITYLETKVICSSDYPIDLVPYDYFKSKGLDTLQVIPNLFHHIGYISSVSSPKNPREFFHLFPVTF